MGLAEQLPHELPPSSWLSAVPGLVDQFRFVPEGFYELGEKAQLTCPCGLASHYVPPARFVPCPCGRLYLLLRSGLRCATGMSDEAWAEHQAEAA